MPTILPNEDGSTCSHGWIHSERATYALGSSNTIPQPEKRQASDIHVNLSNPESLYLKALAHYQKEEYPAAEVALAAVIQLKWNFPGAHLLLGNIAASNREFSVALDRYSTVLEIDPYEPTAHYNIALTYADLKNFGESQAFLEKALSVSPGYSPAYFELAKLLCSLDQTRGAIALLIKSAYKDPLNPDALVKAGELYYEHTFYDHAIKCYQRALKIDPWHPNAYLHLGIAQFRNGQCGLATLSFAHCLNRNPKHKLARAFQKLSNSCLLKFTHPELQSKSSSSKNAAQTSFPFTAQLYEAATTTG